MNKHNSVPNIRFKGFEDEWKGKELNSISKRLDNFRKPITANKRITGKTPYYGANGVQDYVKGYTHEGEFVLIAEDGANDVRNYPVRFVKGYIWVNNHAHVLQAKVDISNNLFLSYSLKNKNLLPYLVGSGRMKLNADVLMNLLLKIPSLKEQQKIGDFFSKLDKLLDLQQQKIDKLELLKKTLLQKLFPKHDAQIPELRFKGFEDDWQEKKLSHVVDIIMGQSPSSTNYYDTPIENSMILIQGNADIKHHNVKPRIWTTQITKIAIPKDVLLTVRAPVGEVAKNKYEAVIGRGMAALRGNDFLYYNLEKLKEVGYWERLSTGSTFESISSNDIRDTKIKIPSCKEQKKVYNLLSKVDQLIELENKKLQNFQQVKKCLLQNMFVE